MGLEEKCDRRGELKPTFQCDGCLACDTRPCASLRRQDSLLLTIPTCGHDPTQQHLLDLRFQPSNSCDLLNSRSRLWIPPFTSYFLDGAEPYLSAVKKCVHGKCFARFSRTRYKKESPFPGGVKEFMPPRPGHNAFSGHHD